MVKTHEYKTWKKRVLLFYLFCAKKIKLSGHWRTLGKCRNYSPAARVFYISLAFSNARRVLSQCNKRLRLFYLLNTQSRQQSGRALCVCAQALAAVTEQKHLSLSLLLKCKLLL